MVLCFSYIRKLCQLCSPCYTAVRIKHLCSCCDSTDDAAYPSYSEVSIIFFASYAQPGTHSSTNQKAPLISHYEKYG